MKRTDALVFFRKVRPAHQPVTIEQFAATIETFGWEDEERGPDGKWESSGGPADSADTITIGKEDIALKGSASGTGTPDDPIFVGRDLDRAVTLLAEGKSIRLDSTKEVGLLVAKMAPYAKELQARGEKAPNLNLCGVQVEGASVFCHDTVGVPRAEMPQLRGVAKDGSEAAGLRKDPSNSAERVSVEPQYDKALTDSGVKITDKTVPAEMLRASQNELNGAKVSQILNDYLSGRKSIEGGPRINTTKDGYVLDGHHRWAAAVAYDLLQGGSGNVQIPVHEVGMDIGAALDFTNAFTEQIGLKQEGITPVKFAAVLARLAAFTGAAVADITFDASDDEPRGPDGRWESSGGGKSESDKPEKDAGPSRLNSDVPLTTAALRDQIVAGIGERFTAQLGDYPKQYDAARAAGAFPAWPNTGDPYKDNAQLMYRNVREGSSRASTYDRNLVKAFVDGDKRSLTYISKKQDARAADLMVEHIDPRNVAVFKEAIDRVNADPHMQQVMDQYGVPTMQVGAADGAGLNDSNIPDGSHQIGTSTVTLYENAFDRAGPNGETTVKPLDWPAPKEAATTVSGGSVVGTLTHEYGHYVQSQLSDDQRGEWARISRDRQSQYDRELKANLETPGVRSIPENTISFYAMEGNGSQWSREQESFAETFAAVMHPEYDRNNYDQSNHPMLQFMEGIVGPKP